MKRTTKKKFTLVQVHADRHASACRFSWSLFWLLGCRIEFVILSAGQTGVLFIEGGILDFIYCHILNNGSIADNLTIGVLPDSK